MRLLIGSLGVLVCALAITTDGAKAADGQWQERRSAHVIVYYQNAPQDFLRTVEEAAERSRFEIMQSLGFSANVSRSSENRVKIYIYKDANDYVTSSRQFKWSHGAASTREKTIRTFPTAHGFFDSTLPHELGHIVFREFIGFDVEVPLWFEEGVAMYQEKAKRWGSGRVIREAMKKGQFISLSDLTNMRLYNDSDPKLVDLFYAESASIVYYMITELGEYRFANFCRSVRDGRAFEDALNSVYGRFNSLDDLNRVWVNYLNQSE